MRTYKNHFDSLVITDSGKLKIRNFSLKYLATLFMNQPRWYFSFKLSFKEIFEKLYQHQNIFTCEGKMIIDFRMRPPFKSFLKMGGLYGPNGSVHSYPVNPEGTRLVPSADKEDMTLFLKEMSEAGIDKGCVLGRRASTMWSGAEDADIHELCSLYPDKFIGFGAVDVAEDIIDTLALVDECKHKYNFRGMVCEPGNSATPVYPDDRRLYPFYARCVELDMIVVISLSQFLVPNVSYCDASHVQNVCRDFPKGKFVIAHAGYPHVMSAIGATMAEKNLWLIPDAYITIPQVPGRRLWVEGLIWLQGRGMLFGTAYPFRNLEQCVEETKQLGLPKKFYDMYMGGNACELLGI